MSLPLKPSPTLEYAYDDVGNISSYKKNGSVYESYTYDALNQLTSMTRGGTTYGYTYDNAGNLLSQTENGVVTRSYTYGDKQWKDRLTAFNGSPITYDEIGNPIEFYNGFVFTWENGRQLQRVQNGQNYYTYTYDGAGRRTSKNVNGTVTEFFWVGDTLQAQKTGNEYLIFLYDESGVPYGFLLKEGAKEEYYYYVYNLQGDVIGILNSAGTQVVEYIYSPYGEIIGQNGPMADTIGRKNRLTYRGYYHDGETNFYYLKSRYYAPILGRFLNADSYASTGQGVLGHNMYAYCLCNPINYTDTDGESSIWYYLFLNFKFGLIHMWVEAVIIAEAAASGRKLAGEVFLADGQRADIVDVNSKAVWEIKSGRQGHGGKNDFERWGQAYIQASGYVGKKMLRFGMNIEGLGAAGAFSGSFIINCMGESYEVDYSTPIDGVIIYTVNEIEYTPNSKFVFDPKMVTKELPKKERESGGLCLTFVCFAFGGLGVFNKSTETGYGAPQACAYC